MTLTTETSCTDGTLEIRFSRRPPFTYRQRLKKQGFSWLPDRRSWSANTTAKRQSLVNDLAGTLPRNSIIEGDCIDVMRSLPAGLIDLAVTDPPYLVNYKDRTGRSIIGDNTDHWVNPAFQELYRVLKPNSFCISFCGWNSMATFMQASHQAGFKTVGHIVWKKNYASSTSYLAHHHEQAIVFIKGNPERPAEPLKSVLPWSYSGNALHPTQKHVDVIAPLIKCFSKPGDTVLDPFCGSGTTARAAQLNDRCYIGIEKDPEFAAVAKARLSPTTGKH